MKLKRIILLLVFLISVTSCSQTKKTEAIKIMTLLYNMESSVTIPPPAIEDIISGKDKYKKPQLQDVVIDSLKYAINRECILDDLSNLQPEKIPIGYEELVTSYNSNKGFCFLSELDLTYTVGNDLPFVPGDFSREALNLIKTKYGVLGIVSYSPIVINQEKNKALVGFGATREGLDSYSAVFFLKKENGQWRIQSSITLSTS